MAIMLRMADIIESQKLYRLTKTGELLYPRPDSALWFTLAKPNRLYLIPRDPRIMEQQGIEPVVMHIVRASTSIDVSIAMSAPQPYYSQLPKPPVDTEQSMRHWQDVAALEYVANEYAGAWPVQESLPQR